MKFFLSFIFLLNISALADHVVINDDLDGTGETIEANAPVDVVTLEETNESQAANITVKIDSDIRQKLLNKQVTKLDDANATKFIDYITVNNNDEIIATYKILVSSSNENPIVGIDSFDSASRKCGESELTLISEDEVVVEQSDQNNQINLWDLFENENHPLTVHDVDYFHAFASAPDGSARIHTFLGEFENPNTNNSQRNEPNFNVLICK